MCPKSVHMAESMRHRVLTRILTNHQSIRLFSLIIVLQMFNMSLVMKPCRSRGKFKGADSTYLVLESHRLQDLLKLLSMITEFYQFQMFLRNIHNNGSIRQIWGQNSRPQLTNTCLYSSINSHRFQWGKGPSSILHQRLSKLTIWATSLHLRPSGAMPKATGMMKLYV
jgi:hypothetical protein